MVELMFIKTLLLISLLSPADAVAQTLLKVPLKFQLMHGVGLPLGLSTPAFDKRALPTGKANNAFVKVVTSINCGKSQVFDNVLVDTGSAILWVGAQKAYIPGPDTENINETFSVGYGAGGVNGTAFLDTVTIGEAKAKRAIIGSAEHMSGFKLVQPIDGILGLGPSGSNAGEVGSNHSGSTPTFVESLVASKAISEPVFGVYISPLNTDGVPEGTGDITFGGVDNSRIKSDITWVPQNEPVNFHWEFETSAFSFGPNVTLSNSTTTRTDTGVLPIAIPFDQFFDMLHAYNGNTSFDHSALSTFLTFPSNVAHLLPNMTFTIDKFTVSIPPSQYIVPTSLYSALNATEDPSIVRTWIGSGGFGQFVLGQKWLESVYTAYDMNKHQIGFAHLA